MGTAKSWKFDQLGGAKKSLELTGWGAPFGRPRQDAVVRDGIEVRVQEVYYPGSDAGPTRNVFGVKLGTWELHGRFRDRADGNGVGFAKARTDEVKAFVRDQQEVHIAWGDILAGTGFITKFDPGREAEEEVEWKMTISIDTDNNAKAPPRNAVKFAVPAFVDSMALLLLQDDLLSGAFPPAGLSLKGSFLDTLDNFVSSITDAVQQLRDAASSITDFEKATFGELTRFQSTITTLQATVLSIREVVPNIKADAALQRERATDNAKLWSTQTSLEDEIRAALGTSATASRAASVAIAGKTKSTVIARGGDTWESMSTAAYGSPSRAADIRAANAGGAYPTPGVEMKIPV